MSSRDPLQPNAPQQVEFDFFAILLGELAARGLHYEVELENQSFVAEALLTRG